MQYRIIESLRYLNSSQRLEAGTINDLKRLSPETIALLIAKNRISPVVAPPLAVLPGWKEKAAEYAEEGIQTVNDMTGEEDDFAEVLKWSAGEEPEADPDFMSRPIGEDVYEVTDGDVED